MSEKGQKIFKYIVWIIIAVLLIIEIVKLGIEVKNTSTLLTDGPITRTEWMEQLADGFGKPNLIKTVQEGDELATAEYATMTAMTAIGEERLNFLAEGEVDEKKKLDLAIQYGVVDEKDLDKNISEEQGNKILVGALGLYCNPEYYPEYCEVETTQKIINADRWQISEYSDASKTVTAEINGDIPEVGEVIMFTNEYGIAQAKYVTQVNKNGAGKYTIQVDNVENITDIMNKISFSGTSDFNYLLGKENPGDLEKGISRQKESGIFQNPFVSTVHAADSEPIMLAGMEWFEDKTALRKDKKENDTKTCDIEFAVELTSSADNEKATYEVASYIEITNDRVTKKYKYEIDDQGKETFETEKSSEDWSISRLFEKGKETSGKDKSSKDIQSSGSLPQKPVSENGKKEPSEESSEFEGEMGIKANVKITGFGVCTSGYYQWADPNDKKNYVEVLASAEKINISSEAKLSFEEKYKIGSIPIPIASTAGVISIKLNVYLVMGADGELTLWYEMDKPQIGVNVSIANGANGFTPLHGCLKRDAGVDAKIELNGGFIGEAAIMILDEWDLADPGVDVRAYASASTIKVEDTYKVKEEYEGQPCTELKVQAPVLKLTASAGEDSVLCTMLKTLGIEVSYDIIKKDSDRILLKLTYHYETEDNGKSSIEKLEKDEKHEDVCTHIKKKTQSELRAEGLKDEIDKKVEDGKEEVRRRIEQMIEAAVEKWLAENCGGC